MKYYFINNYMYNYASKKDSYTLLKCEIKHVDAFLFKAVEVTVRDTCKVKVDMTTRKGDIAINSVIGPVLGVPLELDKQFLDLFDFVPIYLEKVILDIPGESKAVEYTAILI